MSRRCGFGPVFLAECLTTSRRWQVYAGRSLLIASVLAAMTLIWLNRFRDMRLSSIQENAAVGLALFDAIMAVEMVLAIAIVPAAAAGAICQDKMRGGLIMMMVTDLSDSEIVLGKLASRLVTILGIVACGLPVLAILTSLGGVDPLAILAGSMVLVGVAVLGVSLAMTFSVWATRPHEALTATYAAYAIWLLTLLAAIEFVGRSWIPRLIYVTNPFWLLFGARSMQGTVPFLECLLFLVGSLAISMLLAFVSTRSIRAVTIRQTGRPAGRTLSYWWRLSWFGPPAVSPTLLDRDPAYWRELHRRQPAGWGRAIWRLYGVVSVIFAGMAIIANIDVAPATSAFIVSIGLLMVSVNSSTSLAEERAHGSLDLLMTTPLSSQAILVAKWRGAFRAVPRLAVLPGVLALGSALMRGHGLGAILFAGSIALLVVAYGAVITSLGLALATWQPRLGRAVGFSVAAFLTVTVVCPTIAIITMRLGPDDALFLWVSPFFGMLIPMGWVVHTNSYIDTANYVVMPVWIGLTSVFAYALLLVTIASFDRILGRMPVVRTAVTDGPWPRSVAIGQPRQVHRSRI
jgi:ABC-type transport system involved in multi-copper enzyme maturation permease subunit